MVDYIINTLDLSKFMVRLQPKRPASSPEETMLATINSDDVLNVPGGFTYWCLDKFKIEMDSISRYETTKGCLNKIFFGHP